METASKAAESRGNKPQGQPQTKANTSPGGGAGAPPEATILPGWDPRKGGELFDDGDDEPGFDPSQLRPPTEEDLRGLEADLDMALEDYGFGYRRCSKLIRQVTGLRVNPTLLWRFRRRRQRERLAEQRKQEASAAATEASAPDVAPAEAKAGLGEDCRGTPEVEGLELAQRMVFEAMQARFREMNVCSAIEVKDLVGMMVQVEGMALKRRMTAVAEEKVALARAKEARAARREARELAREEAREQAERRQAERETAAHEAVTGQDAPSAGGSEAAPSHAQSRLVALDPALQRFTQTDDRVSPGVSGGRPAPEVTPPHDHTQSVEPEGAAQMAPRAGAAVPARGAVAPSHAQSRLVTLDPALQRFTKTDDRVSPTGPPPGKPGGTGGPARVPGGKAAGRVAGEG